MKKLINLFAVIALLSLSILPAAADDVSTGLTRGTGGGSLPIVKVKWEMKTGTQGEDDSTAPGAQFIAPGVWGSKMNYTVCAIVTDPNGVADIAGVYADIYYPEGKAIHDLVPSTDVHKDPDNGTKDKGQGGCGAFIEQNTLLPLSKSEGYNLFCDKIRSNNNNLPTFYSPYTYDEICATDGELMKEEAYVYCDPKTLIWEDPAGDYKVLVTAQDKAGNNSTVRKNYFEYLPLTGFEKDFSNVGYGQVLLNTHKKISGDVNFGTASNPTIRNTGNTRLWMKVAQDDMGLGKSSNVWNVKYDARVGNHENDWTFYDPFGPKGTTPGAYTQLEDILDLSEIEEMDFSILVTKWPDTNTSYSGTMWLKAAPAPFRICQ